MSMYSKTNRVVMISIKSYKGVTASVFLGLVVLFIWAFPGVWYQHDLKDESGYWVKERSEIVDWVFTPMEVSTTAEKILVADTIFSGEFEHNDGQRIVRVFSARRERDSGRDIGLFVHTPDRCWTEAGWELLPDSRDYITVEVGGVLVGFERRVFQHRGRKELVYFCGLVNGEQLPYRLDHNYNVGLRVMGQTRTRGVGTFERMKAGRFWNGIKESFIGRRYLWGPKQFVRLSTPVISGFDEADKALEQFLQLWLSFEPLRGAS